MGTCMGPAKHGTRAHVRTTFSIHLFILFRRPSGASPLLPFRSQDHQIRIARLETVKMDPLIVSMHILETKLLATASGHRWTLVDIGRNRLGVST